jgi:predicted GIY-YIG superfamily endonuclease
MKQSYIYLISFDGTNDIYIGLTTNNICKRFKQHKKNSTVSEYVLNKLNNDWSKVHIDIIDTIDMDKDLTHLLNHPSNSIKEIYASGLVYRKYTFFYKTQTQLANFKLQFLEHFHIHSYKNEGKYNLINKKITNAYNVYELYKFLNYAK